MWPWQTVCSRFATPTLNKRQPGGGEKKKGKDFPSVWPFLDGRPKGKNRDGEKEKKRGEINAHARFQGPSFLSSPIKSVDGGGERKRGTKAVGTVPTLVQTKKKRTPWPTGEQVLVVNGPFKGRSNFLAILGEKKEKKVGGAGNFPLVFLRSRVIRGKEKEEEKKEDNSNVPFPTSSKMQCPRFRKKEGKGGRKPYTSPGEKQAGEPAYFPRWSVVSRGVGGERTLPYRVT